MKFLNVKSYFSENQVSLVNKIFVIIIFFIT